MKTFLNAFILLAILSSCTDPVEKATETIDKKLEVVLSDDIQFVSSSMYFINYSVITNYWYDKESSYRDILNDCFNTGIIKLQKLKDRSDEIITSDVSIQNALSKLNLQIDSALVDLKQKKKACESLNGLFGMMYFGGSAGAYDLADALNNSSKSEKERKEKEKTQFPNDVLKAFNELEEVLEKKYYQEVSENIFRFETDAIDNRNINREQHKEIRAYLKKKFKIEILKNDKTEDTKCRERMINSLFEEFDNSHPIHEN
ncbi:MAG: hypothetical protein WCH34_04080 [Bacteroidota bacterium]